MNLHTVIFHGWVYHFLAQIFAQDIWHAKLFNWPIDGVWWQPYFAYYLKCW